MKQDYEPDRTRIDILCLIAVLAVLGATLSPFDPFPPNAITWLEEPPGIRFGTDGLVLSHASVQPPEKNAESYTLELWIRPTKLQGAHTILAFYSHRRPKQLQVRQYFDSLLVTHDPGVDTDRTRTIKFDVNHVLTPDRLVYIAISSGQNGTVVFVNDHIAEHIPSFRVSREELAGEIIIGTSTLTHDTWSGELVGLAIYSKSLTPGDAARHYSDWKSQLADCDLDDAVARYSFHARDRYEIQNEVASGPNLTIPTTFSVPHKGFLLSPVSEYRLDGRYAIDVLVNIAGFVPLGLIICACLSWTVRGQKAIVITVLACGFLSTGIEILQYYIPRRSSGMTDIITNTVGGLIGAMLLQVSAVRRILQQINLLPGTETWA
jgi:VanZ family protein